LWSRSFGVPRAALPSAANVHDTGLFPDLLRLAQVVCTAIGRLCADAGYDSVNNCWLCLRFIPAEAMMEVEEVLRRDV